MNNQAINLQQYDLYEILYNTIFFCLVTKKNGEWTFLVAFEIFALQHKLKLKVHSTELEHIDGTFDCPKCRGDQFVPPGANLWTVRLTLQSTIAQQFIVGAPKQTPEDHPTSRSINSMAVLRADGGKRKWDAATRLSQNVTET